MTKAGFNQLFLCSALFFAGMTAYSATNNPAAIPWNQIGAKAGADYKGDGLTVNPTETGARLHCVFQRLDAETTPEGLWLTSTAPPFRPRPLPRYRKRDRTNSEFWSAAAKRSGEAAFRNASRHRQSNY